MRFGKESTLAPDEVIRQARAFFGPDGELGLPERPGSIESLPSAPRPAMSPSGSSRQRAAAMSPSSAASTTSGRSGSCATSPDYVPEYH